MSNMQEILEDSSGNHRITLLAVSGLAVIVGCCVFVAGFFTTNASSFESNVNIRPNPQRCGDHIFFSFNDRRSKSIDPADFQSVTIVNDSRPGYKYSSERKGMNGFLVGSLCGIRELRITIAYHNKRMDLILRRIPGDKGEIYLYAIPFSKGTFTFDFENDLDKTCEDNVKGWHGECTISPKRIKKTSPDSSKHGRVE